MQNSGENRRVRDAGNGQLLKADGQAELAGQHVVAKGLSTGSCVARAHERKDAFQRDRAAEVSQRPDGRAHRSICLGRIVEYHGRDVVMRRQPIFDGEEDRREQADHRGWQLHGSRDLIG
jgi:hypothetical protein